MNKQALSAMTGLPIARPKSAARDATDNIKRSGPQGATQAQVDSVRRQGVDWTRLGNDTSFKEEDDPLPHALFSKESDQRYGRSLMDEANDKQKRVNAAKLQLAALGMVSKSTGAKP